MPHFHFQIFDGKHQRDEDGTYFPDLHAAQVEAIRFAGEILKQEAHHFALGKEWHMDITDASDVVLIRLDFSAVAAPAAPRASK